eukprot:TRINITY_DN143_c0_g2_i3.p1 TRINITY_DN143_c0_g2~~TRINITY_DN143_c0_g2_i3.p1  ORF type:complete len:775 (-),score=216.37 TRINITY_DN143_c0_g2_i3:2585-4909(-)
MKTFSLFFLSIFVVYFVSRSTAFALSIDAAKEPFLSSDAKALRAMILRNMRPSGSLESEILSSPQTAFEVMQALSLLENLLENGNEKEKKASIPSIPSILPEVDDVICSLFVPEDPLAAAYVVLSQWKARCPSTPSMPRVGLKKSTMEEALHFHEVLLAEAYGKFSWDRIDTWDLETVHVAVLIACELEQVRKESSPNVVEDGHLLSLYDRIIALFDSDAELFSFIDSEDADWAPPSHLKEETEEELQLLATSMGVSSLSMLVQLGVPIDSSARKSLLVIDLVENYGRVLDYADDEGDASLRAFSSVELTGKLLAVLPDAELILQSIDPAKQVSVESALIQALTNELLASKGSISLPSDIVGLVSGLSAVSKPSSKRPSFVSLVLSEFHAIEIHTNDNGVSQSCFGAKLSNAMGGTNAWMGAMEISSFMRAGENLDPSVIQPVVHDDEIKICMLSVGGEYKVSFSMAGVDSLNPTRSFHIASFANVKMVTINAENANRLQVSGENGGETVHRRIQATPDSPLTVSFFVEKNKDSSTGLGMSDGNGLKVSQAMLIVIPDHSTCPGCHELVYQATRKRSGGYSVSVDPSKMLSVPIAYQDIDLNAFRGCNGVLKASLVLVVGDASLHVPVSWMIADDVHFSPVGDVNAAPASADGMRKSVYTPLKEILHVFRADETRPSNWVSLSAAGAVVAAFVLFILVVLVFVGKITTHLTFPSLRHWTIVVLAASFCLLMVVYFIAPWMPFLNMLRFLVPIFMFGACIAASFVWFGNKDTKTE